ncbi:sensor histidine kinase [Nocardia asteroides]|uniref:sensor histidine kinase n=1 Tax=Nocardia asteroides TaxID=1824 RepID=UPI0033E2BC0A
MTIQPNIATAFRTARFAGRSGIRARILAIALIPGIALLSAGAISAAYLVNDGKRAARWAQLGVETSRPVTALTQAVQKERRVSLLYLAGDESVGRELPAARTAVDAAAVSMRAAGREAALIRTDLTDEITSLMEVREELAPLRRSIDTRTIPLEQGYSAFAIYFDNIVHIAALSPRMAPDAAIAARLSQGNHLLRAAESITRSQLIVEIALRREQPQLAERIEFEHRIGEAQGEIAYLTSIMQGPHRQRLLSLTSSAEWNLLLGDSEAILTRSSPGQIDLRTVAAKLSNDLLELWVDETTDSHQDAERKGQELARQSVWGAAVALTATMAAFLLAVHLANRFIGRLRRLRLATLDSADRRLPDTLMKLKAGDKLDTADLTPLHFGFDEIGQVADAFNRAHAAGVHAAVAESKTQAGVRAVFLDIAYRSQVIVHEQLELLDRAEHQEQNPERLELLFQLDHLATRARRNAENLSILGGEAPGRRWRLPVQLLDIVRGAVAESADYKRIRIGRMPELAIDGASVADLIHMLAELTDNATMFSPPASIVSISAHVVGNGIAIEIADQGIGMAAAERAEHNKTLASMPDFSVAALSDDTRLGLFVVGSLAARQRVSVHLTESEYGGTRAIIRVPSVLVADSGLDALPPGDYAGPVSR